MPLVPPPPLEAISAAENPNWTLSVAQVCSVETPQHSENTLYCLYMNQMEHQKRKLWHFTYTCLAQICSYACSCLWNRPEQASQNFYIGENYPLILSWHCLRPQGALQVVYDGCNYFVWPTLHLNRHAWASQSAVWGQTLMLLLDSFHSCTMYSHLNLEASPIEVL